MSHIYENPVETEVYLIARILSLCVSIKKTGQVHLRPNAVVIVYHFYHYNEVTVSQWESSCELFDIITTEIYNNSCILEMYKKWYGKIGNIFQAGIFYVLDAKSSVKSLKHIKVIGIYITDKSLNFVLPMDTQETHFPLKKV